MDVMVYETQKWLNNKYSGDPRYIALDLSEDGGVRGQTGWTTIYALTRALQIELGIAETADNFGPSTQALFQQRFPNGISQQADGASATSNIYGIIQGALWCKGYSTGASTITEHFYGGTGDAIKELKRDMGLGVVTSVVTLNVMKALLSMDQFRTLTDYGGTALMSSIQRRLNEKYEDYIGIIPTDGLYGRAMNLALIKVLQCLEGYSVEDATGNFGDGTKANIIILPDENNPDAIQLFRYCMICNGYIVGTGTAWDAELESQVRKFQNDYVLTETGKGDLDTWMSLLLSKGNTDRSAIGCDCSEILDDSKAKALFRAGYRYVGRYLTGTVGYDERPKNLTRTELKAIFDAGLRVFAIFQEGVPSLSRYTYQKGLEDGVKAIKAARELGIPENEIIYFAIDYDVMDGEIASTVKPYFQGIRYSVGCYYFKYRVGIYGARNVCSRICNAGLAESSFVSDMSTGFSGNMGYPIPSNWAFDQFHEYMFYYTSGAFALDKDAVSGRYLGFDHVMTEAETVIPSPTDQDYLNAGMEVVDALGLGIEPPLNLVLGVSFEVDFVGFKVSYEIGREPSFESLPIIPWQVFEIEDGKLPDPIFEATLNVFDSLDVNIKAQCGMDGAELNIELAEAIKNGTLSTGVRLDQEGNLEFYYRAEKILWTNADGDVQFIDYVLIKYTFKRYVNPGDGEPAVEYDYSSIDWEAVGDVAAQGIRILVVCALMAGLVYVTGGSAILSGEVILGALPSFI